MTKLQFLLRPSTFTETSIKRICLPGVSTLNCPKRVDVELVPNRGGKVFCVPRHHTDENVLVFFCLALNVTVTGNKFFIIYLIF